MGYLAPDVLAGGTAGPSGDVYALAVATFTALTGAMPRAAGSIAELVAAGGQPPPLVSSAAPDLGTAFDDPIAAALDPDPANRPDALAFAASLTSALGTWSRARSNTKSAALPAATDLDATTAVVPVPVPPVREDRPVDRVPVSPVPRSRASSGTLITAAVIGGLVVLAVALASGRFAGLGAAGQTPGSSTSGSPAGSPSLSLAPSASPTIEPTAVPTPSVAERALAALDDVDAAVDAVRDSGDLKNKEMNDLVKRARDTRSALDRGDLAAATKAADSLSTAAGKAGEDLDEDLARRLEGAVKTVVDILHDR
jgi:hypothetical protein